MRKPFLIFSLFISLGILSLPQRSLGDSGKIHKTPAPAPLEYILQDIKGTVLILEKGSSKPGKAEEEETVESGDEIITQSGSKASLTLNKTTMFHLSENSRVKIDQLARRKSSGGFISRLELIKGKILSEVEKLRHSRSVFEVSSGGVICGVRGTAFEVQNEGSVVQTSTYHGLVEMKKDDQVQTVGDNQHLGFAFDQETFLPKRALTKEERDHYQNWLIQKAVVEQKLRERQAVLDSMVNLSAEEKDELLQKLDAVQGKDRLKTMRQMLQDKYLQNRQKLQEDAVKNRAETLRKIQEDAAKKREENNRPHPNNK